MRERSSRRASRSIPRSLCPLSISLEMFGDRWSLLIVRDLMVRGYRTFGEFQQAGERIATNILADRLQTLERRGLITAEADAADRRRVNYRLTAKGIDLAPVLLDLLLWAARHEAPAFSPALIRRIERHRNAFLAEVRRRWRERDSTPLMPSGGTSRPSVYARGRGTRSQRDRRVGAPTGTPEAERVARSAEEHDRSVTSERGWGPASHEEGAPAARARRRRGARRRRAAE